MRRTLPSAALVCRGSPLSLNGHQLHRPPDTQRPRADIEGTVPLDQYRFRVAGHRVPRGVRDRTDGRGRFLDRVGTRIGLTTAVALYSACAMLASLATGLRSFAGCRFLLGLGRVGELAGATKAVAEWFPRRESGWAVALFDSGSSIGAAVAPFLVLATFRVFGSWRPVFIVTGRSASCGFRSSAGCITRPNRTRASRSPNARTCSLNRGSGVATQQGRGSAGISHAAVTAADVGDRHRQGPDRSGVVLHHGLVGDLTLVSRGFRAGRQPAGVLGALSRGGPRKLRRRRACRVR